MTPTSRFPSLSEGDRSDILLATKAQLSRLGYAVGDERSPEFDHQFDSVVRRFQQDRGLLCDGLLGPETFSQIELARHRLGDRVLRFDPVRPLVGDDVAELQKALSRLGIYTHRIDYIFAEATDAAVREAQTGLGLRPDGIAGPTTLAGLRAGAELTGSTGAGESAQVFAHLLEGTFGRGGWQRYRDGGGADSALALFDATGLHGMIDPARLGALRSELSRPAGGIAPGAAWKQDGISWTPSTSLLGLGLARAGEHRTAREILSWLAAHRTEQGSLPEKVLHDGRPAQVAPLAWTAANTLLALDALAA